MISLAPYTWIEGDEPHYAPPAGVRAAIDLRTLEQQSTPGGSDGVCVCSHDGTLPDAEPLGEPTDRASNRIRDAFQALTGYRPKGDTIAELVYDLLTDGSDPGGGSGPRPLLPTSDCSLDLHLAGRLRSERFIFGQHPHSNRVRDVLRSDFENAFNHVQSGKLRAGQHQRMLDLWCEQFGVDDWREFVHPNRRGDVPGRLKHETIVSDDFTRADSDTVGNGWTELVGNWRIVSNQLSRDDDGVTGTLTHGTALSSQNHYAQATITAMPGTGAASANIGVACRYDTTANSRYVLTAMHNIDGSESLSFGKVVAGSATIFATPSWTMSLPQQIKVITNGSSIDALMSGVSLGVQTDTSITGYLTFGLRSFLDASFAAGDVKVDDFMAEDIYGASPRFNRRPLAGGFAAMGRM